MTDEIDGIPGEAFREYEEVRLSGATNMFDRGRVQQIAISCNLEELLEVIDEGRYGDLLRNYSRAVSEGIIQRA